MSGASVVSTKAVTSTPRAVLAASFTPGSTAVPAATRFTREVLTAWAAMSVAAEAEQLAAELVADVGQDVGDDAFEVLWAHHGDSVQIEVREKGHSPVKA